MDTLPEGLASIESINKEKVMTAYQLTKSSFKRTKTVTVPARPIPTTQCIPTMASAEQIEEYESQFVNVLTSYLENRTINDLLKVFSYSVNQILIGKIYFLGGFFKKIKRLNINLDVAVLCNDFETQSCLFQFLRAARFNCAHLTSFQVVKETYGVVVKLRKAGKAVTPVKKANVVDIVMIYDSAVNYPCNIIKQFKGVAYETPQVVYITTLDSADIRCFCSPNRNTLHWSTRYKNVDLSQAIFHQSNRRSTREQFMSWNDYLASEVAEWAATKTNLPFVFFRPHKDSAAAKAIHSWGGCHPLHSTPIKYGDRIEYVGDMAAAAAAAAPTPAMTTSTSTSATTSNNSSTGNTSIGAAKTAVSQATKHPSNKRKQKQKANNKPDKPLACTLPLASACPEIASSSSIPTTVIPARTSTLITTSTATTTKANSTNSTVTVTAPNPSSTNVVVTCETGANNSNSMIDSATSFKRPLGEVSDESSSSSTKKAKSNSDNFMPAFDFSTAIDEAMKEFEKQLNSINIQL